MATAHTWRVTDDIETLRKWLQWEEIIRRHLYQAHHHRQLWRETTAAIQAASPSAPAAWLNHYAGLYSDGQAMAIRRIVRGRNQRSANLDLWLSDMAGHPSVLSASRYAEHFPCDWSQQAREEYERLWGDGHGKLDPAKAELSMHELKDSLAAVYAHADKRIAHIDMRHPGVPLAFADLDAALDLAGHVHQHWARLLTGTLYEMTPVPQAEWQSIFAKPIFTGHE
jgi:hypothetical protein